MKIESIKTEWHNRTKVRFGMVGVLNTIVDLGVYTALRVFLPVFFANLVSTSCGMVMGYVLHRSFTFRKVGGDHRRDITAFLTITAFGQWVLQPLVIVIALHFAKALGIRSSILLLLGTKCVAIAVSLVWNFLWYSGFVFRKEQRS